MLDSASLITLKKISYSLVGLNECSENGYHGSPLQAYQKHDKCESKVIFFLNIVFVDSIGCFYFVCFKKHFIHEYLYNILSVES